MSSRAEIMQHRGLYTCPGWCLQPPDEDNTEEHRGAWTSYTDPDGTTVQVRPVVGWDETGSGAGTVELRLSGQFDATDGQPGLRTTAETRSAVDDLISDAQSAIDNWTIYDPPQSWQWAYPGAEDDEAAVEEDG